MEIKMHPDLPAGQVGEIMTSVEFSPKTPVYLPLRIIPAPIGVEAPGTTHRKVKRERPPPSAGLPVTRQQRVILHPDKGPDILVLIIVDPADQVQNDMRLVRSRKGIPVKPHPCRGRQLG